MQPALNLGVYTNTTINHPKRKITPEKPGLYYFSQFANEIMTAQYTETDHQSELNLPPASRSVKKTLAQDENSYKSKAKRELWNKAARSEDIQIIKSALAQGARPADLNAPVTVNNQQKRKVKLSPIDIALHNNEVEPHEVYQLADKLLQEGAKLPTPYRTKADFNQISEFFSHLVSDSYDLYIHLHQNPKIIKIQDENGETLLHAAAYIGRMLDSYSVKLIHYLIFRAPGLDFNVKNYQGNTPLHVAALNCNDLTTYNSTFPYYLEEAKKANFDFSTLGQQGQAILHIATRVSYKTHFFGRQNNLTNLLRIVPDIDVNVLSSSGSTALYYAIFFMFFAEAKTLLNAGANPSVYSDPERAPLFIIDNHIQDLEKMIAKNEDPEYQLIISDKNLFNGLLLKVRRAIALNGMDAEVILRHYKIICDEEITDTDERSEEDAESWIRSKSKEERPTGILANKHTAAVRRQLYQAQTLENLIDLAGRLRIEVTLYGKPHSDEQIEHAKASIYQLQQLKARVLSIIQQ
jgi:ankyrin repeat protein